MNVVDIIIILGLFIGGVSGAHNGFFKQSVVLLGTIATFVLAWIFKTPLANLLSYNLPFFNFAGPFEGVTALNIVMYQFIAFIFVWFLFLAILIVLTRITNIFEKLLKLTVILGVFSKILGFIVGVLEAYVIIFIILFFLNLPVLNLSIIQESKLTPIILNSSPVLSHTVKNTNEAINDIYKISKDVTDENKDELNKEIIETLLKHKVVDQKYLDNLKSKGKISY